MGIFLQDLVAKIAIEEAVKDVNCDSSVLPGTRFVVNKKDSNCNMFVGTSEALQFMSTDTIAVIGPQSSVVAHLVSHVTNAFQVPLLTTQSDLYQMTAIAEIIEYYDWKQVVAIFIDDDYGRNGVAELDDALAVGHIKISHKVRIPPSSEVSWGEIMNILVKVALLESRIFVLHAYPDSGFMVFSVAHYLGMMGDRLLIHCKEFLFYVNTPDSDRKRTFFSRWNKLTGGSFGLNTYGLYAYDTVWLVAHAIDSFFNQGAIISFPNDSNLNSAKGGSRFFNGMPVFDGGVLLLKYILQSNFVGLTGPIKFNPDRPVILPVYDIVNVIGTGFRRIGYWSNYSGLSTVPPETLYSKPANRSSANQRLYGVVWPGETTSTPRGWVFPNYGEQLRIGVPIPVSYKEFVSQVKGTNTLKGFCIDVFTAAVNLLPYPVPYLFIPFGDGQKTPSYTELVNLVATGPFAASGLVVVAPCRRLNTDAWAFLHPFSPRLWGVIAALFVIVGVVVWILERRKNDEFRGSPKEQLITILWRIGETPVSTLGRIVLIIWLFIVLIINSSYTANLTSILTVQHLTSHIDGIETLKVSDDPIGYQVGSFAERYLNEEIGIPKSRLVPLASPEEYATALQRGPKKGGVAAVVEEQPYIELFLSSHCKFRIVGQVFTKSSWGFAFPRDSPLAVDMSTAILTLSENGELQRIHDEWLTRSTRGLESAEIIESGRLHMRSFLGLYLICAAAWSVSLFVYFLKIKCSKYVSNDKVRSCSKHLRKIFKPKCCKERSESKRRKVER
ncbi:unnamed protein product [Camellia sinensis]